MLDRLFGKNLPRLERAMTASALRQKVIANNIANVNTPGFKRSDVSFSEMLDTVVGNLPLKTTRPNHIQKNNSGNGSAEVIKYEGASMRQDGNNVDVDIEMANLADTELRYAALTEFAGRQFKSLNTVINGGSK